MKHYKEITETITRQIEDKVICDLCKKEGKFGSWEESRFEINETEISIKITQKEGYSYPDCGRCDKYEIDLCPDCFKNVLVPFLESKGADIRQECLDW